MKKVYFTIIAFALSVNAMAQFANPTAINAAPGTAQAVGGHMSISYTPATIDVDEGDDLDFDGGLSFEYILSKSLVDDKPLFYEYGLEASYLWFSDSEGDSDFKETQTINYLNCKIPVNLTYKYQLSGQNITICPLVGVYAKLNLLGNYAVKYTGKYAGNYKDKTISYFDGDDVGDDYVWKRFQFGWQIGVNVEFSKYVVGIKKSKDMSELIKDADNFFNQTYISVGVKF